MFYKKTNVDRDREQKQGWIEARDFFGSAKDLCNAVNQELEEWEEPIKPSTINAWINEEGRRPRHEIAVVVARLTGISLERLSPFTTSANGPNGSKKTEKIILVEWSIQKIIVPADFHDPMTTVVHAFILVDAKGVLIYGLSMLRWYQDQGKEQIPVMVVDLHAIKPETPFLENFDCTFSISQRSVMSSAFKKIAPKRQGLRFDLLEKQASEPKNIEKGPELCRSDYTVQAKVDASLAAQTVPSSCQAKQGRSPKSIEKGPELCRAGYEVKGRTDNWVAKTFGFTSKELLIGAQKLYDHAPEWLIVAVDREEIPITKAARMLKKPQALEACRHALCRVSTPSIPSGAVASLKKSQKTTQKKECSDEALF